jgi:hypothetical protein
MERKQLIVQRTREAFGDQLDKVLHMVQQDRQQLRGWQEPAHLRAVLRRAAKEGANQAPSSAAVGIAEPEIGQGAGEPDKGEQREALGQILEAGAAAVEKLVAAPLAELTHGELFGLECVLLLYGRPALLVSQGRLAEAPAFWNIVEDQRQDIELSQRGVGRIELVGHPEYDWAGTGFLVGETCLMTTRTVARHFAERQDAAGWQFRPAMSAWMDYQGDYQRPASAAYRVKRIIGVHDRYDLALMEVEPPQHDGDAPAPLALAAAAPSRVEGRAVYLVGYPVRDARRGEPETIARVFRDVYNVKRVQPGTLRAIEPFHDIHLLRHDCAPLGQSAGACLVDLETHQVLGLHVSGRYLENGTAIPVWMLGNDPLLADYHVTLAQATAQEVATVSRQIERLARTRHWQELRETVGSTYERAFGKTVPNQ